MINNQKIKFRQKANCLKKQLWDKQSVQAHNHVDRHFIVFEGVDYSGKTTVMEQCQCPNWVKIKVPYDIVDDPQIDIPKIKNKDEKKKLWTNVCLTAHQKVLEHLEKGKCVILDRWLFSTVVYQAEDFGLEPMLDEIELLFTTHNLNWPGEIRLFKVTKAQLAKNYFTREKQTISAQLSAELLKKQECYQQVLEFFNYHTTKRAVNKYHTIISYQHFTLIRNE